MAVKTAISIPDELFEAAEEAALRFGMTRSELYQRAIADWLEAHRGKGVTELLDEIYAEECSSLDPVLAAMQFGSLSREEW
ncbi:MAG: ChpI protein [Planctomycetota bacterium]|jgi:metal-responsive CopG/Arc/MetJ family transcriptional regulator